MHCYDSWSMSLYDIDPGKDCPEIVRMIVEIPKNSANQYEYDGTLGVFRLDRALYSAVHYPGDYGFMTKPGTQNRGQTERFPVFYRSKDLETLETVPSVPRFGRRLNISANCSSEICSARRPASGQAHLLQLATRVGRNLLIPNKAMPVNAKS